jgi:hypothetical protein
MVQQTMGVMEKSHRLFLPFRPWFLHAFLKLCEVIAARLPEGRQGAAAGLFLLGATEGGFPALHTLRMMHAEKKMG